MLPMIGSAGRSFAMGAGAGRGESRGHGCPRATSIDAGGVAEAIPDAFGVDVQGVARGQRARYYLKVTFIKHRMANSVSLPQPSDLAAEKPALAAVRSPRSDAAEVRVVDVSQDREVTAWLAAVGLHEGEEVSVLRRAAFGGPIHIRTSDGGEFALNRHLARSVGVTLLSEQDARGRTE